jgi:hypothetical protein
VIAGSFCRSAPGGGVARVHERRLAPLDALGVHPLEVRDRVVDLAADLDHRRHLAGVEPVGHRVDA